MKLKKIKNTLLVVLTLALVSAASVALTYAAVSSGLGSKENTFTSDDTLDVTIYENEWDGKDKEGNDDPSITTKGQTLAGKYSTSMPIPKNPKLYNSSEKDDSDEYLAMTVKYTVKITGFDNDKAAITNTVFTYGGYTDFSAALATVSYNGIAGFNTGTGATKWTEKEGSDGTVFYFNELVANGGETSELFDTVKINDSFDTEQINGEEYYKISVGGGKHAYTKTLPYFEITLKGYAVQADGIANASAAHAPLNALIAANNA